MSPIRRWLLRLLSGEAAVTCHQCHKPVEVVRDLRYCLNPACHIGRENQKYKAAGWEIDIPNGKYE